MSSLAENPVSVVSTGTPTTGFCVSMVMLNAPEVCVFPATSVATAVIECVPSLRTTLSARLHAQLVPDPLTAALPNSVAPSYTMIVGVCVPSSTVNVPLKPGVLTLVMSSLAENPVSVVSTGVPTTGVPLMEVACWKPGVAGWESMPSLSQGEMVTAVPTILSPAGLFGRKVLRLVSGPLAEFHQLLVALTATAEPLTRPAAVLPVMELMFTAMSPLLTVADESTYTPSPVLF